MWPTVLLVACLAVQTATSSPAAVSGARVLLGTAPIGKEALLNQYATPLKDPVVECVGGMTVVSLGSGQKVDVSLVAGSWFLTSAVKTIYSHDIRLRGCQLLPPPGKDALHHYATPLKDPRVECSAGVAKTAIGSGQKWDVSFIAGSWYLTSAVDDSLKDDVRVRGCQNIDAKPPPQQLPQQPLVPPENLQLHTTQLTQNHLASGAPIVVTDSRVKNNGALLTPADTARVWTVNGCLGLASAVCISGKHTFKGRADHFVITGGCLNHECVAPDHTVCNGVSVLAASMDSDPTNCGGCGVNCGIRATCKQGLCMPCAAGSHQLMAGSGHGKCTNECPRPLHSQAVLETHGSAFSACPWKKNVDPATVAPGPSVAIMGVGGTAAGGTATAVSMSTTTTSLASTMGGTSGSTIAFTGARAAATGGAGIVAIIAAYIAAAAAPGFCPCPN